MLKITGCYKFGVKYNQKKSNNVVVVVVLLVLVFVLFIVETLISPYFSWVDELSGACLLSYMNWDVAYIANMILMKARGALAATQHNITHVMIWAMAKYQGNYVYHDNTFREMF